MRLRCLEVVMVVLLSSLPVPCRERGADTALRTALISLWLHYGSVGCVACAVLPSLVHPL